MTLEERLASIEAMLAVLVEGQQVRQWYPVEEFARLVGRSDLHLPPVVPAWPHPGGEEEQWPGCSRGLGHFPR